MRDAVWETSLPGLPPPRRGKVRDVYDLGDALLLVACDRISAYDHVLRPAIPGKGKILNQLSNFWFEKLGPTESGGGVSHHLLATEPLDTVTGRVTYSQQILKEYGLLDEARGRGVASRGSGYSEI